ncbi:MAG: alpha/beta fold hydrolase [Pirellulales bacterium]|nr:alpha/beta fold hydrolase [Pirellulales bacterium]
MASPPQNHLDWRSLYPFESRWAELASGRMHYLDEGPGSGSASPPSDTGAAALLFVHGNPTWSFHWRRFVAALRSRHRCVAVDHLGCGQSDRPERLLQLVDHIANLRTLVEQLDLRRITLVAQDWGGAIGLGAMLRMPERLQRIVLFNTGAFSPHYIPWRIRACRLPVMGRLAVQGANLFSLAALRMTLARRKRLEPAVDAGYLAPYDSWADRRGVYAFVRDIPAPHSHDSPTANALDAIERQLPSLADRPACLVWGMRDWCFRPDCLDRFLQAWPRAEVHRLADVGHWVVEDAPEESLGLVQQFLACSGGGHAVVK